MRKHLVLGALLICSLSVASVQGGIFSRGGGCANGSCGARGGYSGGYYATNVVKSPSDYAAQAAPAQPVVVAQPAAPQAPAAPEATVTTTTTRASNVSTSSSPRGRFFRRWSR